MQLFEQYQLLERHSGWTSDDARRVQALGPLLSPYFDGLVDDFYTALQANRQAARAISGGAEQLERLKRMLRGWLDELFSGQYGEPYVLRRWNVGKRHVDIGLDQLYTNASLARLRRGLLAALEDAWCGEASDLGACRDSLNTLLDLNAAIMAHAYHSEYQRRQATAARLAAIGKVAGSIVEELRGPLDAIQDSTAFLLQATDPTPETRQHHLDRIGQEVDVAEEVVSSLNQFVRLPQASFQAVEVIECLAEAVDRHGLPKTVRVQWQLPVPKLKVLGDPAQLRIVLGNLVRKAHAGMPSGGLLRLTAVPDGDAVYIAIQHSHCACTRASPSSARATPGRKRPGISLGHSILHDIILRHRGALTILVEESVGTTTTLRLPAHP